MKKKRSAAVPLLVLGTLAVSGCDVGAYEDYNTSDSMLTQKFYTSKEECEQDWNDGESCRQESGGGGYYAGGTSGGGGSRWAGPRYYWDRSIDKPVEVRNDGTRRIINTSRISSPSSSMHSSSSFKRGGFGSFSRGFSSGG